MNTFSHWPQGSDITANHVIELMKQAGGWEDKYRQVILLGKQLPALPDGLKTDQVKVSGCESQVWLTCEQMGNRWFFGADSDARIVRGLIVIVLAAIQGKTADEIQSFNMDDYFAELDLLAHLSASRGNGIKAIISEIYARAQ